MRKLLLPALAAGIAACSDVPSTTPTTAVAPPTSARRATVGEPIPGQYIVQFRPSPVDALTNARYVESMAGGTTRFVYTHVLNGAAMRLSDAAAAALRSDPRVLSVDQDQVVSINTTQNNPPSWGLDRIDQRNLPLSATYTFGLTGAGVTAYVLDTGLNFGQTDFGGRAFAGPDEVTAGGSSVDCNGHGTHTAGTLGSTTYGVAKGVKIVAIRVLDCFGNGTFAGVIAGIDWVTANATRPAVASMSLGGPDYGPLDTAVAHSMAAGITYVVAAGNNTSNACAESPGNTPGVITIGATTITDAFAVYSNFGSCVTLNAPGSSIKSWWIGANGTTNTISGTSMATPHVSGVAAMYLQANPNATPSQVRAALVGGATPNVITSVPAGTPNLLLNTAFISTPPSANFTSSCSALACSFDGTSSSALPNATYSWSFGDATTGTGKTASHTYATAGTYAVSLTVTDANGTNVKTSNVVVGGAANQAPVARFSISCPTLRCSVDGSTSTDDVGIVLYTWNWGNGRSESHTGPTANNTWATAGVYNVTLTVKDGGGLTNAVTKQVTIPTPTSNQAPTATISSPANPSSFVQGTPVNFAGTGQDPEDGSLSGGALVWTSNLAGQIGTGTSFSTSSLAVGQHTITLKATDSQGAFGTTTVQVTITAPNQAPTASIATPGNGDSFTQGTPVAFSGSGQDPEDGPLGGGSLVWTSNLNGQIGTGPSFSTSGLSVGVHTITLKATDSQGAFGTASIQITITAAGNQPPVADFTFTCGGSIPHQCSFNGGTSTDDHGIVQYKWDWGNGRTETHTGATARNTWTAAGTVNVTLTVTDGSGLTSSITKAVPVP